MNRRQEIAGEAAFYGIAYRALHGHMIEEQVTQEEFELPEIEIIPTNLSWDDIPFVICELLPKLWRNIPRKPKL